MAIAFSSSINTRIAPILGAIRSTGMPASAPAGVSAARQVMPFVTISREAGAGGVTLARALVERLNGIEPDERPWQALDRELIERIAADHQISQELIASLEETSHNWLTDFFSGITLRDDPTPSEVRVFHSVAATVRALAQAGRVVMVGCGAGYIAGNMPGGVHVRLVADFQFRVRYMARLLNLPDEKAAEEVRRRDANRAAFFKRFFPQRPIRPEEFTLTFNSGCLSEEEMVAAILAVLTTRGV